MLPSAYKAKPGRWRKNSALPQNLVFASCNQRYWSGAARSSLARTPRKKNPNKTNSVTAGDGNPRDLGCASPLERLPVSVPASLPPTRNFQAVSSHSVVFFFFSSLSMHFLVHPWKHITTLLWKKTFLSLSGSWREEMQLEWVEIFPLKHFFPVENVFSNYTESFVNARTVLVIHWGALLFPSLKIPHSRCCIFWLLQTPPFFSFFFHRGRIWVGTPKVSKKNIRTEVA